MKRVTIAAAMLAGLGCVRGVAWGGEDHWVEPMKKVHAKLKGQNGTVARIGDGATASAEFFRPLRGEIKNLPDDAKAPHKWIRTYVQPRCWNVWKGPEYGNSEGMTSASASAQIEAWLTAMNPEVALVMLGTHEIKKRSRAVPYAESMRTIVQECLDNGTVPILCTIPPLGRQAGDAEVTKQVESYVDAVRKLSVEMKVPLIDLYKEVLARRPTDFAKTLLAGDLKLSCPAKYRQDFSQQALSGSGQTLRNYLTLKAYCQVYQKVLSKVESARESDPLMDDVWGGSTYKNRPAILVRRDPRKPSALDGWIGEPVWKNPRTIRFRMLDGDTLEPANRTQLKIYTNNESIFIAMRCLDNDPAKVVRQKRRSDDKGIFKDDHMEVLFSIGPEPTKKCYHIVVNPAGSVLTALGDDPKAWNPKITVGVKIPEKGSREPGGWYLEMGIPLIDLELPKDRSLLSGPWRINVTRIRQARKNEPAERTAVAPTESTASNVPEMFAYAWFEVFGGKMPEEKKR